MASNFGWTEDYQDLLIACLVEHGHEFYFLASELKSNYFTGVQATITARCLIEYQKTHDKYPSWIVLKELVIRETNQWKDSVDTGAKEYLDKLKSIDTRDWEHVLENVATFLRERAYVVALQKAVKYLQDEEIPAGGLAPLFEEAAKVGQNLDDLGFIFHADVEKVVKIVTAQGYGVQTGYPLLDKIWTNGWGPGWLIVPLAPPKRYKSGFCVNLACNMVSPQIGVDVIYYACEISQELAMVRAMCNIAGLSSDYMFDTPEKFTQIVTAKMKESVAGNLIFKSFASKTATISDIRSHAKTVVKLFNLKLKTVIIDFAETVTVADTKKEESEVRRSAAVYIQARALGAELGCCVVMPDRCNKATTDKAVPSMTSFQGSFEKAGIVDVALGLCSTDGEYRGNVIRLFNFLNRHGAAYQHLRGRIDPISWRMEFNEQVAYSEEVEMRENDDVTPGRRKSSTIPRELIDP